MKSVLEGKLELFANIAIIVVALLIGVILVKQYFFTNPKTLDQNSLIASGSKIQLPDIDWNKNKRTLLLAIAPGCKFCSESASFYQQLVKEISDHTDLKLIVVSPKEKTESQKYLQELGIPNSEIKQAPLSSLQIKGSPALILADNTGTVTNVWFGKLTPEQEINVINTLNKKLSSGTKDYHKTLMYFCLYDST